MSTVVFTNSGGNVKFNRAELGVTEEKNITVQSLVQLAGDFPLEIFSDSTISPSQLEWPLSSLQLPLIQK